MKRKTFQSGDSVEIRREVSKPWEPATYDKIAEGLSSTHGYHWIQLLPGSAPLYFDRKSGSHFTEQDQEGHRRLTDRLIVPSRRIRAARVHKDR